MSRPDKLRDNTRPTYPSDVPTERAIQPEDVAVLVGEAGINAVMIGAVVTGREAAGVQGAAERFAAAVAAACA